MLTELLEARRLLSAAPIIRDLGTLGGDYSEGFAVNNGGVVAGISDTSEVIEFDGDFFPISHAFVAGASSPMVDLGHTGKFSGARGINEAGQVVGFDETDLPDPVNGGNAGHAMLWYHGHETDLGVLPGTVNSDAWGINARGQVVGWSFNTPPDDDVTATPLNSLPFIWQKGAMSQLPLPADFGNSFVAGINDRGEAAGYSHNDDVRHAIVWEPAQGSGYRAIDLGIPDGFNRSALRAINNQGDVAGQAGGGRFAHAFLWQHGPHDQFQPLDLGVLPGATGSSARGVNSRDEVVGISIDPNGGSAFLYDKTGLHDLNDFLPANSGWFLLTARSISDSDLVTGLGLHNGAERAYVLNLHAASWLAQASSVAPISLAPTISATPFSGHSLFLDRPTDDLIDELLGSTKS
jgi:uncharacterized membrane protein